MFTDQVIKLFPNGRKGFGEALLEIDRVHGNIECGNSCIRQLVDHVDAQKAGIGGQVNPEVLFRGVVSDSLNQVGPQKRLAPHISEHPATRAVKPVNGSLGRVFGHAFHFVVEGPTVMAIEIALEFGEEVGDQGMEVARGYARTDVGKSQPRIAW